MYKLVTTSLLLQSKISLSRAIEPVPLAQRVRISYVDLSARLFDSTETRKLIPQFMEYILVYGICVSQF